MNARMKTVLGKFCEEFDARIRPLLDPLDRFTDQLGALGEDAPLRALRPELAVRHSREQQALLLRKLQSELQASRADTAAPPAPAAASTASYQLFYTPEDAKQLYHAQVGALEQRLARLESALGRDAAAGAEDRDTAPLLPALAELHHKVGRV